MRRESRVAMTAPKQLARHPAAKKQVPGAFFDSHVECYRVVKAVALSRYHHSPDALTLLGKAFSPRSADRLSGELYFDSSEP